ncbi:MAG: hypothetical protein QOH86_1696 [Sphingomonadales bacterium]|jgi:hypothetical protein|nr:hypothetical protein [Sphingomonadales bacterium]
MILLPLFALAAAPAQDPCAAHPPLELTVAEILAAGDGLAGRCVTVVGRTDGIILFANPDEALRLWRARHHPRWEDFVGLGIGFYPMDEEPDSWRKPLRALRERWRITGVVDTCARMIAEAEAEVAKESQQEGAISFVSPAGYCHYWQGPVLRYARLQRAE